MSLLECPPLLSLPKTETAHVTPEVVLSTYDRYIDAKVVISCPDDYHVVGPEAAVCLDTGSWNVEKLPHCSDITYGVPDSTKIYIAIFASCGVLVILSFAILIARILCVFRRPLEKSSRNDLGKSTESVASIRYFPQNGQFHDPVVPDLHQKETGFDSFYNPGYISNEMYPQTRYTEHTQDHWRGRQASYDSSFDGESSMGYIVDEPDSGQRDWGSTGSTDIDRYDKFQNPRPCRIQEVVEDDRTSF